MATLEQRLATLESKVFKAADIVTRFICEGTTPTPDEQARIDEAKRREELAIVRTIV